VRVCRGWSGNPALASRAQPIITFADKTKMTMRSSRKSRKQMSPIPAPGRNTREKIVVAAIDLFNQKGIQHVAIEHIARHMHISPGNLTYHFKRKRDLIHATFESMQERLRIVLQPALPPSAPSPLVAGVVLFEILRAFWEFRFFFNALTFLLSQNPILRVEYFRFQKWALQSIEEGIQNLIDRGSFREIRFPNNTRLLAENMWSLYLNWLRMQQLESPTAPIPERRAMYDSALHHWSLVEPYFNEEFADELLPVYRKLFLNGSAPATSKAPAKRRKRLTPRAAKGK
jgi:AcrR family transcriptional regulator